MRKGESMNNKEKRLKVKEQLENEAEYKGYIIAHDAYSHVEYWVEHDGEEETFDTLEQARRFVDSIIDE